eukprot:7391879-Prymnesium_polylepis.1
MSTAPAAKVPPARVSTRPTRQWRHRQSAREAPSAVPEGGAKRSASGAISPEAQPSSSPSSAGARPRASAQFGGSACAPKRARRVVVDGDARVVLRDERVDQPEVRATAIHHALRRVVGVNRVRRAEVRWRHRRRRRDVEVDAAPPDVRGLLLALAAVAGAEHVRLKDLRRRRPQLEETVRVLHDDDVGGRRREGDDRPLQRPPAQRPVAASLLREVLRATVREVRARQENEDAPPAPREQDLPRVALEVEAGAFRGEGVAGERRARPLSRVDAAHASAGELSDDEVEGRAGLAEALGLQGKQQCRRGLRGQRDEPRARRTRHRGRG